MKKYKGIHLYININNLNSIIKKDEKNHEDLRRTFHALDAYTWAIENFANEIFGLEIEKFTTSRYHFYIQCDETNNEKQISSIIDLIVFSKALAETLNTIGKYQSLKRFTIGIGMDWGQYTEYSFVDNETGYEEMTTIGSPANRAAKLQSKCEDEKVLISKALFEILSKEVKKVFYGKSSLSAELALKYYDLTVYETTIDNLQTLVSSTYANREKSWLEKTKEHANSTNLDDIQFFEAKARMNFTNLSLKNSKWMNQAIVLFSDIRGFTNRVDTSGLSDVKVLTQNALCGMNKAVQKEDGVHVQFQGDRESALFNSFPEESKSNIVRAISAAMRMIDMVDDNNGDRETNRLDIGIGCAVGVIFATRIGMRGRKFNVVMGETVKLGDIAEDDVAGTSREGDKTEIAITKDVFSLLKKDNSKQAKEYVGLFKKRDCDGKEYYISTTGYKEYQKKCDEESQAKNAERARNNYGIKPWGK